MRTLIRTVSLSILAWLVLGAIWALNSVWPLHAPPHHEALLDFLIGLGAIVGRFLFAFGGASVAAIIRAFNALRQAFVQIGRVLGAAIWEVGKRIARAVRAFATLLRHALPKWLQWAYQKVLKIETWLKQKFAPIVKFLKRVRDEFDRIYKNVVRPILDTIEFIRQLNRVLESLHIHVLQSLDRVLAQIEARIDQATLWIYSRLTIVENWINKIVTLDGFFQRLTLIASLERYAPDWINGFWRTQISPQQVPEPGLRGAKKLSRRPPEEYGQQLGVFYRTGGGEFEEQIGELLPIWRRAAGLDGTFEG